MSGKNNADGHERNFPLRCFCHRPFPRCWSIVRPSRVWFPLWDAFLRRSLFLSKYQQGSWSPESWGSPATGPRWICQLWVQGKASLSRLIPFLSSLHTTPWLTLLANTPTTPSRKQLLDALHTMEKDKNSNPADILGDSDTLVPTRQEW